MRPAPDTPNQPPIACVKCGARDGLVLHPYSITYTPAWLRIGLLLCFLPFLVIGLFARTTHRSSLLFCDPCWRWCRNAKYLVPALYLLGIGSILGGIYLVLQLETSDPMIP